MANCSEYLEFVNLFEMFCKQNKSLNKRSFPKEFAFDKSVEYWDEYEKSMKLKISLDLHRAKILELDDRTKRALLMTSIPKDKGVLASLRLPYPIVFLDCTIDNDDEDLNALNIQEDGGVAQKITGVLISEQQIKDNDYMFMVWFPIWRENTFSMEHFKISFTEANDNMQYAEKTKPIQNILKRLVVNTILFSTQPEVEWLERKRDAKNQERRLRQGKRPLPDSMSIRLTGSIKRYFDEYGSSYDGTGYAHQFDVRGTWRHFNNQDYWKKIYKLKKDELASNGYKFDANGVITRWIGSFKKGKGLYVNKKYSLEKPLEEGEIDLQSIKPLTKPLREMRV